MEGAYSEKFSFRAEWYDKQASLTRQFYVFFYPVDDTLEMFEVKRRKAFVRRVRVDGITIDKFYIGGTLNILGRAITIVDFGCADTKKRLEKDMEICFLLIKPLPTNITGKILRHLHVNGLRVTRIKKALTTPDDALHILRFMVVDPTYPFLLESISNQFIYGVEVVGKDAPNLLNKVIGDKNPLQAEPGTIRALYGQDEVRNCVYVTQGKEAVFEDLNYFFPTSPMDLLRLRLTATLSNCTLCIVKPHAVREGKLGLALEYIEEGGFNVTALNMLNLENINVEEFYEVYKGIVSEFQGMVEELSSGPCVAMEIVSKDKTLNSAAEFRKLVGPSDPEIARLLRPHTLRAKLGVTKIQNAIHCSDLPEDGLLEVEYFFKILAN